VITANQVMGQVLFCRKCGNWYAVQRVVPDVCPNCEQSAEWTTETLRPWKLSENDRKFLRAIRIKPEA